MTFAFTVLVPLSFAFLYLLAVFSYGLAGDLTARHSLYPARMFTLPVSTAALAGWPMLYGTMTLAALWVAATLLALRPSGVAAPLVWPALFAAAFLAWMQVFTWMPYGLPGLRMIAAVLWLTTIDAVVFTAMEFEVRESADGRHHGAPDPPRVSRRPVRRGPGPSRRRPRLAGSVRRARPDRGRPSPRARAFSLRRPRPGVVRVAAARPVAAGLGGHRRAVRAPASSTSSATSRPS